MLRFFFPAFLVAAVASLAVSGVVAERLRTRRSIAWLLLVGTGLVLAATLTPREAAWDLGIQGPRWCDLSRVGPPSWAQLLSIWDAGGNILMFVPLGVAIALLPRSGARAAILVGAVALPFAIEVAQLLLPALGRTCQSGDVVDNLTGLGIGLAVGWLAGTVAGRRAGRREAARA